MTLIADPSGTGGNAHHIAERRENNIGLESKRNTIVGAPERNHADRTARTVNHLDIRRQKVFDAVFENRVCVPAANFH